MLRAWNDRSRKDLGDDTLDLVQLHGPSTPVFSSDEVFDTLDEMVAEGRVRAYRVSVETCAEARTAISGVPDEVGVVAAQRCARQWRHPQPSERCAG